MKRRLAAALLIITLPLVMAACHGTNSRKATPSTPAPAATANADPTQAPSPTQTPASSSQSVDEACSLIDNQLKSFADSYKDTSALTAAEVTISVLNSPQITNPDVKQASSKVASALQDMVNFNKKYQSNPNAADPKEAEQLTQNLTDSLLSLGNLCPAILK